MYSYCTYVSRQYTQICSPCLLGDRQWPVEPLYLCILLPITWGKGKKDNGEGYRAPRCSLRGTRRTDGQGLQVASRTHPGRMPMWAETLSHRLEDLVCRVRHRSYASRPRGINKRAPERPNPPPLPLLRGSRRCQQPTVLRGGNTPL